MNQDDVMRVSSISDEQPINSIPSQPTSNQQKTSPRSSRYEISESNSVIALQTEIINSKELAHSATPISGSFISIREKEEDSKVHNEILPPIKRSLTLDRKPDLEMSLDKKPDFETMDLTSRTKVLASITKPKDTTSTKEPPKRRSTTEEKPTAVRRKSARDNILGQIIDGVISRDHTKSIDSQLPPIHYTHITTVQVAPINQSTSSKDKYRRRSSHGDIASATGRRRSFRDKILDHMVEELEVAVSSVISRADSDKKEDNSSLPNPENNAVSSV